MIPFPWVGGDSCWVGVGGWGVEEGIWGEFGVQEKKMKGIEKVEIL